MVIFRRLAMLLAGRRNLAGCGFAVAGGVLALLDPVGPRGAILVALFYLTGAAAAHPSRAISREEIDASGPLGSLDDRLSSAEGRLPAEAMMQIRRIHSLLSDEVFPRLDRLPPGSPDRFLVGRIASDYLPTAINNYLRLSGGEASQPLRPDSEQAQRLFIEELGLIEAEVRRIWAAGQRMDIERSMAHRRFLADRFGTSDLEC